LAIRTWLLVLKPYIDLKAYIVLKAAKMNVIYVTNCCNEPQPSGSVAENGSSRQPADGKKVEIIGADNVKTSQFFLPTKASADSIGHDLFSIESVVVKAKERRLVSTGLRIAMPPEIDGYGRIAPRSGLASKHSLDVSAGVIDPGYRGELKVLLVNHGSLDYQINVGDRIAQIIFERTFPFRWETVSTQDFEALPKTNRGSGGFGSSGSSGHSEISVRETHGRISDFGSSLFVPRVTHKKKKGKSAAYLIIAMAVVGFGFCIQKIYSHFAAC
jgi:dUTP pyrophosphatase